MVELVRLTVPHIQEWEDTAATALGCTVGWVEWVGWEGMAQCMEVACMVGWEGCLEIQMIRTA
jgi:hypothetical protein